jgi:transposase
MKSARERMDVVNAYFELGSYRAAAECCGTTPKTVKRIVARWKVGELDRPQVRPNRARNTDVVADLVARRVEGTRGRISAKRLLPEARAAGYTGSARNFRRVVHRAKATWGRTARIYRPWVPSPGEHLVIDWGEEGGLNIFCAVLAWSRYRFVRFAPDQRRETTLRLLAECFEDLGGVPAVVLADRMGCLKAGVVANVVVPHPEYVRFATHFAFRPDFCEAADPESKGVVENLVGYAQRDLVVPAGGWGTLGEANEAARCWCVEVNARVHSQTMAVPLERLGVERELLRPLPTLRPPLLRGVGRKVDRLATVRIGSARYSVPCTLVGTTVQVAASDGEVIVYAGEREVARHTLVAPGACSISDEHYDRPAARPRRAVRPRSAAERAFLGLGMQAEAFLRAAAAAGTPRLASEISEISRLHPGWPKEDLVRALARATEFRRFSASAVRAILEAGAGVPGLVAPGGIILGSFPAVPTRALSDYAAGAR